MGKAVTALAWRPAAERPIQKNYGKKEVERHQLAVAGEDGSLRIITLAQKSNADNRVESTEYRLPNLSLSDGGMDKDPP